MHQNNKHIWIPSFQKLFEISSYIIIIIFINIILVVSIDFLIKAMEASQMVRILHMLSNIFHPCNFDAVSGQSLHAGKEAWCGI